MDILVCNAGSTSLKFKLYDMPEKRVIAHARIERVGDPAGGLFEFRAEGTRLCEERRVTENYENGIRAFLDNLLMCGAISSLQDISAVGFKTTLSTGFYGVHIIDGDVIAGMEDALTVAPAHNRHYLAAIRTFMAALPDVALVGVFETAFHMTMPPEAYIYPVPYEWYEKYGVRRLGYHGASHEYVAGKLTRLIGPEYRAVSCHLGGSCSVSALVDGKSVDNSFGMSLQAGLPQSNRSGDIDPYIIFHMAGKLPLEDIEEALQKKSGLLGISGVSGDMRDIEDAAGEGNFRADLAIKIFRRELLRYIGGYAAILGGVDAIAFTGGIGENAAELREHVMDKLAFLGVRKGEGVIEESGVVRLSANGSRVKVFVIDADEEEGVAEKTYQKISE